MKKFILVFVLLIGIVSFNNKVEAQNINISINVGHQPAWGPTGYDYVDYYYMPDINCYYNVNMGLFYYPDRGRWISASYLPYAYRQYDLYGMYKVVLVNTANPWRYNNVHYRDYGRYKGYRNQYVIRDSRDDRYRSSRNNRVAWYSGDKNNNYRRDHNNYNNNNYNNNNYNNNRSKDNNKRDYNYNNNRNSSRNDGRNNNDKSYNDNKKRDNKKEKNYNDNRGKQSDRGNSSVNSSRSTNRNDNKNASSRSSERSSHRLTSNNSERVNRR